MDRMKPAGGRQPSIALAGIALSSATTANANAAEKQPDTHPSSLILPSRFLCCCRGGGRAGSAYRRKEQPVWRVYERARNLPSVKVPNALSRPCAQNRIRNRVLVQAY